MIRGGLIALICSESLKISTATASESAILTLTGPDVGFISSAFEDIHEMWLNPIEIVLATWLLARQTGAACVGPMISVLRTYSESFLFFSFFPDPDLSQLLPRS